MTNQAQNAAASTEAKGSKPKVVLAAITVEASKAFTTGIVGAVITREKADVSLLATVAKLAAAIGVPMTAAQYDKQLKPALAKAFAAKVAKGFIAETTAASYQSRVKTATLAIVNKVGTPLSGETFQAFTARVSNDMASAKQADGVTLVWEGKKGRTAKAKGSKASGSTVVPLRGQSEPESQEAPAMAAALILCEGDRALAAQTVVAFGSFRDELKKYFATIVGDEKATAKRRGTRRA